MQNKPVPNSLAGTENVESQFSVITLPKLILSIPTTCPLAHVVSTVIENEWAKEEKELAENHPR